MSLINKHNAAILFIDLLGISDLTNNRLILECNDFEHWLKPQKLVYNYQNLTATILLNFQKIFIELNQVYKNISISTASDFAIIWSQNITELIVFASQFMNKAINAGLLCRGGMTYGEIIEVNHNKELGRLIIGDAVNQAVNIKGITKGSRVLIDKDFPHFLTSINRDFAMSTNLLFSHFTNPVDFTVYDEFKWYLYPGLTEDIKDISKMAYEERKTLTKQRLKIANNLIFAPKFGWISKSKEGIVHLKATINFIAENGLLDIYHDFDWEDLVSKRDENILEKANRMIDNDLEYYPREYKHLLDLL